jgi:AcrR family transcriptional regulator
MPYAQPQQQRARATEQKFLIALDQCLAFKSFHETTVDDIAEAAGLHRGAFMKRFGSKKEALLVLFSRYCERAHQEIRRIRESQSTWESALLVCKETSVSLEKIQKESFACNRAMHEVFMESLKTDEQTKDIFLATVRLLREVQLRFFPENAESDSGTLAATQLLVSINYNYVLKAMPGLPRDDDQRHTLIAECMVSALRNY